jgi:YVTN family beta-propeller protein
MGRSLKLSLAVPDLFDVTSNALNLARALVLAALLSLATAGVAEARFVYVGDPDGAITPVDVFANVAEPPIPMAGGARGIAITPDGATAYVVNQNANTVTPFDTRSGEVGVPIAVGSYPLEIALTPDGSTAYVTNSADGTVTPIDVETNTAGAPIPAGGGPAAVAVAPDGATAYVASFSGGGVTPIDTATNDPGPPIAVGADSLALAITPDGATAYVASDDDDTVTPIDLRSHTPGTPIPVGSDPFAVALAPDGATAYVASLSSDGVTPIDTTTNSAGPPIEIVGSHYGVAVTPDGATVYVTRHNDGTVIPIDAASRTVGSPIAVGLSALGVAIEPNQPPRAAFDASPRAAGSATSFDASASSDPDGDVVRYQWDFGSGDSIVTSEPTVAHSYERPGTYTATLTVVDDEGCSTELVFTGKTASCNGSAVARAQRQVTVASPSGTTPASPSPSPTHVRERALSRFALDQRCVRQLPSGMARVRMSLRLARPRPVHVRIQRAIGSRALRKCPKPRAGRSFGGRFRDVATLKRVPTRPAAAAASSTARRITLRLRLAPGLYRVTVRARIGADALSRPARRFLRVLG